MIGLLHVQYLLKSCTLISTEAQALRLAMQLLPNVYRSLWLQVRYMNEVLDAGPTDKIGGQGMGRQGLGLEMTNQRSVSSVLTKASEYNLHPQEIADAGLKVRVV